MLLVMGGATIEIKPALWVQLISACLGGTYETGRLSPAAEIMIASPEAQKCAPYFPGPFEGVDMQP